MPLIALGWCRAAPHIPASLTASGTGPVRVLCADEAVCASANDRLRSLQSAFDAGLDMVALSPLRTWSVAIARELATKCATDLLGQLDFIAGAGQLCVAATWDGVTAKTQPAGTGRDWLQQLRLHHHERQHHASAAQKALATLVEGLDCPKTAVLPLGPGCGIQLLVQRNALAMVRQFIVDGGANISGPAGMAVTVTGLWPALDFVTLPTRMMEVPA